MEHDKYECQQLRLFLNIKFESTAGRTEDMSYGFLLLLYWESYLSDMKCFYKKYVLHVRRCEYLFARDYILSYYISRPLTVYYALQTNLRHFIYQRYVIHNIVTEYAREYENNLETWELLLHITRTQKLIIVIIGPEMKDCYSYGQLCKKCINYKKEILFVFKSVLYHDYIESSKNYKQYLDIYNKPNIIIGFEMNLKECEERMKYVQSVK